MPQLCWFAFRRSAARSLAPIGRRRQSRLAGLGLGVDVGLPCHQKWPQRLRDVLPLACQVVPFADVLPQIEEQLGPIRAAIDEQLPVAAADRPLRVRG